YRVVAGAGGRPIHICRLGKPPQRVVCERPDSAGPVRARYTPALIVISRAFRRPVGIGRRTQPPLAVVLEARLTAKLVYHRALLTDLRVDHLARRPVGECSLRQPVLSVVLIRRRQTLLHAGVRPSRRLARPVVVAVVRKRRKVPKRVRLARYIPNTVVAVARHPRGGVRHSLH